MLPDLAGSPAGQLCFGQFWFSWNNLFDFKSIIHWIWIFGFSTFCFPWIISLGLFKVTSVQFSSVAQLCPTLCGSVDCSTPGVPVHHQLPEFIQTRVRWVSDAIQPSHPLSPPSPASFPASGSFPMSWLFASGGQSIGALVSASVLPMNKMTIFWYIELNKTYWYN